MSLDTLMACLVYYTSSSLLILLVYVVRYIKKKTQRSWKCFRKYHERRQRSIILFLAIKKGGKCNFKQTIICLFEIIQRKISYFIVRIYDLVHTPLATTSLLRLYVFIKIPNHEICVYIFYVIHHDSWDWSSG